MAESLDTVVSFRTSRAERHLFEALAARNGKLLAHFVRDVLVARVRAELGARALGEVDDGDAVAGGGSYEEATNGVPSNQKPP